MKCTASIRFFYNIAAKFSTSYAEVFFFQFGHLILLRFGWNMLYLSEIQNIIGNMKISTAKQKYERIHKNRCTRKMSSHVKRESINSNKWQEYRKYHTLLLAVSDSRWARFWYAHDIWFARENQVQYYPHKRSELMKKNALQYFHSAVNTSVHNSCKLNRIFNTENVQMLDWNREMMRKSLKWSQKAHL